MRILHLADNLVLGGRERRLLELIKGLVEEGHEITLVLFRDAIEYHEVYELPIKLIVLKKRFKKDFLVYFKLIDICKQVNPQVIHTWGGIPSVMSVLLRFRCKKEIINGMIANSTCKVFTKDWFRSRLSFPFSSVIISNSKVGLSAYKVSPNKGAVVPNGYNLKRIEVEVDKVQVKKELELSNDHTKIIGMVASINFRKDFPTFINAALITLQQRKDVLFVIIGDGEDRKEVEAIIPESDKKYFKFLGMRQDVDRFVSVFDIGILATFAEGISNSIMEYMAFAKPVVVSDVPGNRELIEEDKSGYLVPVGNSQLMSDRIIALIDNEVLSDKMGLMGRKIIQENYSQEGMTERYLKIYSTFN